MSVEIVGLAAAKAKLQELKPKQMRAVERTALRAGATLLAAAVKKRAPRRTGIMRSKVSISASVNAEKSEATVGVNKVGRHQEMGTRKMRARPFMRPALEESQDAIVERYGEAFKAKIAKLTNG